MADAHTIQTPYGQAARDPHYVSTKAGPGVAINRGEFLAVRLTTSDATGVATIRGRTLNHDLTTTEFAQSLTFSGTGIQTFPPIALTAGWLIGFDLSIDSGTITDGEVVASVHVSRNAGGLAQLLMCLASGEITNIRSLGLGAFSALSATVTQAQPTVTSVQVANPAAGANFSVTVTAGQVWELYGIRFTLTTDANVANRGLVVVIDDGTSTVFTTYSSTAQAASGAVTVNGGDWGAIFAHPIGGSNTFFVPRIMVPAGYRIRSLITNIQVGDQISALSIFYRQY